MPFVRLLTITLLVTLGMASVASAGRSEKIDFFELVNMHGQITLEWTPPITSVECQAQPTCTASARVDAEEHEVLDSGRPGAFPALSGMQVIQYQSAGTRRISSTIPDSNADNCNDSGAIERRAEEVRLTIRDGKLRLGLRYLNAISPRCNGQVPELGYLARHLPTTTIALRAARRERPFDMHIRASGQPIQIRLGTSPKLYPATVSMDYTYRLKHRRGCRSQHAIC